MIRGSVYSLNFQNILDESLKKAKDKYGLTLVDKPNNYSFSYSNLKCSISIFAADIQSFKWNFENPNTKEQFLYTPYYYMLFVLNKKRGRMSFDKPIVNLEDKIKGIFDNFNQEILDYMNVPMRGDFSWHNEYLSKLKLNLRYQEFSYTTNVTHSNERRKIARMFRRKENGYEEAIESYFIKHYPDGGKEFEVDDIFKKC